MSLMIQVITALKPKIELRIEQAVGRRYVIDTTRIQLFGEERAQIEVNDLFTVYFSLDQRQRNLKIEVNQDDGGGPLMAPAIFNYMLNSAVTAAAIRSKRK